VQPQVLAESPPMATKAATGQSDSSSSNMHLAAHHSQGSCAAKLEDEDGDASTTASTSEPPPESPQVRWADLAAWDKEEEEALLPPQVLHSACTADKPCSANGAQQLASARTKKWADLADSDDEELPQYLPSAPSAQSEAAATVESMPSQRRHSGVPRVKAAKKGGRIPIAATTDESNGEELTRLGGSSAAAAAADGHAAPAARRQQRWVEVSHDAGQAEPSSDAVTWPAWSEQQQQQHKQHKHKQKQKFAPAVAHEMVAKDSDKKRRQSWNQNRGKPKPGAKHQCQFFIGIEEEPTFQVKRRLLGPHGQHMKAIAQTSGAKLRLRGQGSGFLEGVEQEESSDPLMLCVSALDAAAYKHAVQLTRELLEGTHGDFHQFCRDTGSPEPSLVLQMHEGPRPGSR